jgi:hypothetical protein
LLKYLKLIKVFFRNAYMAATMSRTAGWYRSCVVEAQWCGLARIGKDLRLAAKVAAHDTLVFVLERAHAMKDAIY